MDSTAYRQINNMGVAQNTLSSLGQFPRPAGCGVGGITSTMRDQDVAPILRPHCYGTEMSFYRSVGLHGIASRGSEYED
jgi:hypothetical protein